jgi:hypothetical protein
MSIRLSDRDGRCEHDEAALVLAIPIEQLEKPEVGVVVDDVLGEPGDGILLGKPVGLDCARIAEQEPPGV